MQDRYANPLSTSSTDAADAYIEGIDLILSAQPGGITALQAALAIDEQFAVARADLARALQIANRPREAHQEIARAMQSLDDITDQERAHVCILDDLIAGRVPAAFAQIQSHISMFPRDVMMVQPCCGVFGLIGFSGRTGREQENYEFMRQLQAAYADDWWFMSQYAFALCEVGRLDEAGVMIDHAYERNPANANAVHHRAHVHYETGESASGLAALAQWRARYDREGILYGHLAWHEALWHLADNEGIARVWQIMDEDLAPLVATAPPLNVLTDYVALLLRTELAGAPRSDSRWAIAVDYAQQWFPKPGLSFADFHSAAAYALQSNERLEHYMDPVGVKGTAGDQVAQIAQSMKAFAQEDWSSVVSLMDPIMDSHERVGGSRAQRDVLELLYIVAETKASLGLKSSRGPLRRKLALSGFIEV